MKKDTGKKRVYFSVLLIILKEPIVHIKPNSLKHFNSSWVQGASI